MSIEFLLVAVVVAAITPGWGRLTLAHALSGDVGSLVLCKRHRSRLLAKHLEQPLRRLVKQAWLDTAAFPVATPKVPVTKVAAGTGFSSTEALRQAITAEHRFHRCGTGSTTGPGRDLPR